MPLCYCYIVGILIILKIHEFYCRVVLSCKLYLKERQEEGERNGTKKNLIGDAKKKEL